MTDRALEAATLSGSDWREYSAQHIAPLLAHEMARWSTDFHWDQRWALTHVEAAREAGRLPGVVVTDAGGQTRGWVYFFRHHGQLQIGAIVSDSADCTRALMDFVLLSPHAAEASIVAFSPDAPGLASAFGLHGLATEPYDYLVRDAPLVAAAPRDGLRPLEPGDRSALARVLADAYRDTTFLRPFVPAGDDDAWTEYVGQLIDTRGCGEFLPEASAVVDDGRGGLSAALIATKIDADTGHIAQVAVAPEARGMGLGASLLDHALNAMDRAGCARVSLLVARTNTGARRLYDGRGFRSVATFLTGLRS